MNLADAMAACLPVGLALLMVNVGLSLPLRDFAAALRRPRALAVGLGVQVVGLPIAAFFLGHAFGLSPEMTLGLVLVAAAPGGVTSNYVVLLVGADVALSAAMTLASTLVCSLTIPLVLWLGGNGLFAGVSDLAGISIGMAGIAIAPLAAGLAVRHWWPVWSVRARRRLGPVSRLVFVGLVVAVFVRDWSSIQGHLGAVGPSCIALNVLALLAAALASTLARLPEPQCRAIMVEASLQNVAVTIFVANSVLLAPVLAVPALVYVCVMNLSALAQVGLRHLPPRRHVSAA